MIDRDASQRWDTNCLEAFSDRVLVIAITLLILEIGVHLISSGGGRRR